jgi:signal transduction histidine kinase/CheY-like chemotaxis protein/ligand-binding sensor domain-containing protein/AraC-like DNA-binding protein
MKMRRTALILFFATTLLRPGQGHGYNLRQVTSRDGLSSSAVRYVTMDSDGFMWLGTYDGLNRFDGLSVKTYMPSGEKNSIPGNVIRHITEVGSGKLWLRTNRGLCLFDTKAGTFDNRPDMLQVYHQGKSPGNDFFVITSDDSIAIYNSDDGRFHQAPAPGIRAGQTRCFSVSADDILWVFDSWGPVMRYKLTIENGMITGAWRLMNFEHALPVRWAFEKGTQVVFVDTALDLFTLDVNTGQKEFVVNLGAEIPPHETMRDALMVGDDIFFACINDGLKVIRRKKDPDGKPVIERLDLNCGVFCLAWDPVQQVVMIATDGYGTYIYSEDAYSIRPTLSHEFHPQTKAPVRAVMLDGKNNLWVGTKGDGVFCFPNYNSGRSPSGREVKRFHIQNSALRNNMLSDFAESRHNLLWIMSDGPGICYYSYADQRIHRLEQPPGTEALHFLYSVVETDGSTLWVASSGEGLHRIGLSVSGGVPRVSEIETFNFFEKGNIYYAVEPQNDSTLWIASRGNGVVRLNTDTRKADRFRLSDGEHDLADDVLSALCDSRGTMWFGTSFGLCKARVAPDGEFIYEIFNTESGLPGNTVHGILEDRHGYLWLSTNNGLACFDTETNYSANYTHANDIGMLEFSDNAYYATPAKEILLFGGTEGIVSIRPEERQAPAVTPNFYFNSMEIYGNEVAIADYVKRDNRADVIELTHRDNFFTISFVAPDYIRGQNYTYQYLLSGHSEQWINNGKSNRVTFTNMSPGDYTLKVRFSTDNIFEGRPVHTQRIRILPPWYMTAAAYIVYGLAICCAAILAMRFHRRSQHKRQQMAFERMERQKKEEIYESKLRFFTNITHEFCTPLTLIYGPCERILNSADPSSPLHNHASMIRRNAERLNGLIQELIELRRMDTGHIQLAAERMPVDDVAGGILASFSPLAEQKDIRYSVKISPGLEWNTDRRCYSKILTNLVSNAFKYTPDSGTVEVVIEEHNRLLVTRISNSGRGISPEDLPFVFNRYRVLDNLESRQDSRMFSRNGLGLSICHGLVKLLGGDIHVKSTPGEMTRFTVKLPVTELTVSPPEREQKPDEQPLPIAETKRIEIPRPGIVKSRPTILVVDDEPEILWFICEVLGADYNVVPTDDPALVSDILAETKINIIITDVMMPETDGFGIIRELKASAALSHIPVIFLTAKSYPEDQLEGLDAGADMYITKPFDVEYLKKAIVRLLKREEDTKTYYNSALSAFEPEEGRMIHRDDKAFYEKVMQVVDMHFSDPDFTSEKLACEMNISPRQLSRKLEAIYSDTPGNLIRDYKFKVAEGLLVKTTISIDEVIYKSGFNNRGSFYKIFARRYGMTPKLYRQKHRIES